MTYHALMHSILYGPNSHLYMTSGKTIALIIRIFVNKVVSLLFNTLSRFVTVFLPRSKFSSVQSLSRVRLCNPMDCSLPGSSVQGILQARTWPASSEICIHINEPQLQLDKEQQTGSKQEKEYVKAVYCHPVYLTYMQSTSWEILGWMKHKLESTFPGEISINSDMLMTPPLRQKAEKN